MVGIIACLFAWNAGSIAAFQAAPGATTPDGSPAGDDATPMILSTGLEELDLSTGLEAADLTPGSAEIDPANGPADVTPTPAVADVAPTPISAGMVQSAASERTMRDITGTFLELGHGDRTVTASQAFLEFTVPVPPGLVPIGDSRLNLIISHSPLLHPGTSSMTVLANGTPILSTFLDETNETQARVELQVPDSAFTREGVAIQVAFSLHLSEDPCDVGENEARWATVHGNSSYAFVTAHDAGTADLGTIERQFVDSTLPVTIVLPQAPSAAEREAAGKIAFEIGRWNGPTRAIPQIAHASLPTQPLNGSAIYIGTGAAMGDLHAWTGIDWNAPAFTTANGAIPPDHGVLALIQTPYPSLLVSGSTDQAVTNAVNALLDPGTRDTLSGPFAIITGQEPVAPVVPGAWFDNSATLGQLGFDGREFRGNGTHTIDLLVRRPANWVAGDGGNLTLEMQTSSAIVPDRSRLTVSVNGHQLGSEPIAAGSGATLYVVELPADAVNTTPAGQPTGMLLVQITLQLHLAAEDCQPPDPESAWVVISPDSSLTIPHNVYTGRDLARLPAPFASAADQNPFLIVLPDNPTSDDMDAALQIAAVFGQGSAHQHTGRPLLTTEGAVTDLQRASASMVVIGGPEVNPMSLAIDLEQAVPATTSQTDMSNLMHIGIVASLWSDATILMILPSEEGGTASIASLFRDGATLAALNGTTAIVDPNLLPQTTGLAEPTVLPPNATPEIVEVAIDVTPPASSNALVASFPLPGGEVASPEESDTGMFDPAQATRPIMLGAAVVCAGALFWLRRGRRPRSRKRR
jgi:hypothetical protein